MRVVSKKSRFAGIGQAQHERTCGFCRLLLNFVKCCWVHRQSIVCRLCVCACVVGGGWWWCTGLGLDVRLGSLLLLRRIFFCVIVELSLFGSVFFRGYLRCGCLRLYLVFCRHGSSVIASALILVLPQFNVGFLLFFSFKIVVTNGFCMCRLIACPVASGVCSLLTVVAVQYVARFSSPLSL
jgi:hypothetical protein